ncbi:MAG: hypothetical protein PWP52_1740 [Bacteroidales bacterium]|nr:hypothetical protein [Bacteroidales bacterium]
MNREQIKALLEKYYNGETSLEEEKRLQNYFTANEVDEEFAEDKAIFIFTTEEAKETNQLPDLGNEIWNNIEKNEHINRLKNRKLVHYSLSIAASIAILVVSFFFVQNQINKQRTITFNDTYENPELAYLQAKEALLYVSSKLNSGTEYLEPIQKINKGKEELILLSTFNQGLNELKPVQKYSVTDKYIKHK